MTSARAIYTVWHRYFAVFKKNIWYGLVTTFVEPVLYLTSFGFGLGVMIGNMTISGVPVSYRAFVLAGIIGQSVLFVGFFEAAYGAFIRMYYQKIFQAIAVTPVTLSEVLWGELLWCATRATLSASVVLLLGVVIGDFNLLGSILMIPYCFLSGLLFGALGLLVAAKSRTIESISYPQYLLVFPMFLFCGVYFPLSNLPDWMEKIVYLLPLAPILAIVRTATLGLPFEPLAIVVQLVWLAILVPMSRRLMMKRLVA
jgi:lipooligosaccharide transport system permease protein